MTIKVAARKSSRLNPRSSKAVTPPPSVDLDSDSDESMTSTEDTKGKRPMQQSPKVSAKKFKGDVPNPLFSKTKDFWSHEYYEKFQLLRNKPICNGRLIDLDELEKLNCKVKSMFEYQNWGSLFCLSTTRVYDDLVRLFYANMRVCDAGIVESMVLGQRIVLDELELGDLFDCKFCGYTCYFKNVWPAEFEVSFEQAKRVICEKPESVRDGPIGPSDLSFEARVLAHIVSTTLFPRSGSHSNLTQKDVFVVYCLITHKHLNLGQWMLEYMLESSEDMSSLPYGLLITRILQNYSLNLAGYKFVCVSDCYDTKSFHLMGYEQKKNGIWVKKGTSEKAGNADTDPLTSSSVSADLLLNLITEVGVLKEGMEQLQRKMDLFIQADSKVIKLSDELGRINGNLKVLNKDAGVTMKNLTIQVDQLNSQFKSGMETFSTNITNTLKYFLNPLRRYFERHQAEKAGNADAGTASAGDANPAGADNAAK